MSAIVLLATKDPILADSWEQQVPHGKMVIRVGVEDAEVGYYSGLVAILILDAVVEAQVPSSLTKFTTIFVGEPRSVPFEQARLGKRAKIFLSYEESATNLKLLLPLLEEVEEKRSLIEMLSDKARRSPMFPAPQRPIASDVADIWDLIEGAMENIDTRERLLTEFRRASRQLLHASHTVFFTRERDTFVADRGTSSFSHDDPLVRFFEEHPAIVDDGALSIPSEPEFEFAIRAKLALWGARLLIPIHENARLLGVIALGVRDDGQPYDDSDRMRAVFFARLLKQFLARCTQISRLNNIANQINIGSKYLPSTIVLNADEPVPRHVPLIVRDLVGHVRRSGAISRSTPYVGQPFRASAGIVNETGGVWAFWEEVSNEVHDAIAREKEERRVTLRELALTISHELSNALVTLTTFRQTGESRPMPSFLLETMRREIGNLEGLNQNLSLMQSLHEVDPLEIDLRELVDQLGGRLGIRTELCPEPVVLCVSRRLLEYCLAAIINTLAENRSSSSVGELALKLRSTGTAAEMTALLSLRGKGLELEGILPEPTEDSVPNHGRLSIFLAKEILRLHNGDIHAGPGIEGVEILISIRKL